ncbi:MAG: capsular polysaccharide biosynthesis protein, partial [Pseudomonadota bacterium]
MTQNDTLSTTAAPPARRLFAFNGGSFWHKNTRQILRAADMAPRLGWPGANDAILAWGHRPTAKRAAWVAQKTNAAIWRIEDAFFRSVKTGREGAAPLGLMVDRTGCHYDSHAPSDLETLLATHPLDDPGLLARARAAQDMIAREKLSKYNATVLDGPRPQPGFVLLVDQTRGDASIPLAKASAQTFDLMLKTAQADHPGVPILVKTHPETNAGLRPGHFQDSAAVTFWDHSTPVQDLFAAASAVYVVSSQMGFEAILAGHRPVVFGQPFYAGWGLTDDRAPVARRTRTLTKDQLFAAACLIYPIWFDPHKGVVCDFETALSQLAADTKAWRDDHRGWDGYGMRLWKRAALTRAFGRENGLRFDP